MKKKILYFDSVFPEMKAILEKHCPESYDLLYWDEMNEEEKEVQLSRADFLLVATKKLNQEILSKAKQACFIQKTGIGVDNIYLNTVC